jgi:hypothetical protein
MTSIARGLALLVLLSIAVVATAADERPVVLVNFVFEGSTCSRYGATRNGEAERFAQVVATAFANEYQFAIWRTKATIQPGEIKEATLTVQLRARDEQSGVKRGVAYYIDYFRDVSMNDSQIADRAMSTYIGKKDPLYKWDSLARPCGEDANFTKRLRTRVEEDIAVFRKSWMDNFLRYVPIAKAVPGPDADHAKAVTLPVRWKPLHAGTRSQMELNVGGDVKAFIHSIAIHNASHDDPFICANVGSLKDAADVTLDRLKELLGLYKANQYVRLFITDYELARDTHNFRPVIVQTPD